MSLFWVFFLDNLKKKNIGLKNGYLKKDILD